MFLGRRMASHGFSADLNITAAAAQDVTQCLFQIINTNWIAGEGFNFYSAESIVFRHLRCGNRTGRSYQTRMLVSAA